MKRFTQRTQALSQMSGRAGSLSGGLVTKSCPTLADPWTEEPGRLQSMGFHGILQARILELVAISFSRGSSQPRN